MMLPAASQTKVWPWRSRPPGAVAAPASASLATTALVAEGGIVDASTLPSGAALVVGGAAAVVVARSVRRGLHCRHGREKTMSTMHVCGRCRSRFPSMSVFPRATRASFTSRHRRMTSSDASSSGQTEKDGKSIEERFENFTRVLPWFNFAAGIAESHVARRQTVRAEAPELSDAAFKAATGRADGFAAALCSSLAAERSGDTSMPTSELVEALLWTTEEAAKHDNASHQGVCCTRPLEVLDQLVGWWEVAWSGAYTPLKRFGLSQCICVEVSKDAEGTPMLSAFSGLPLPFGFFLWTSCAGELVEVNPFSRNGPPTVCVRFNRYWIDLGREPRPDIGRIDGGLITDRVRAFGAALVTPVLLEFGALRWLLGLFGLERVFEVEVPSPESDGRSYKLQASLELYLTLLAMVAFPETLSTCPVPFLDVDAGVCVFEIPLLGPVGDLPRWLHPGGNAAALVARKLPHGKTACLI